MSLIYFLDDAFKSIGNQFVIIFSRNDDTLVPEGTKVVQTPEDRIIVANAVDEMIENKSEKTEVKLTNGELLTIEI